MELKLNLEYSDILELIKQLPENQLVKLKSELESQIQKSENGVSSNSLQELLLQGPTMSDEEYEEFLNNRKHFSKWRAN